MTGHEQQRQWELLRREVAANDDWLPDDEVDLRHRELMEMAARVFNSPTMTNREKTAEYERLTRRAIDLDRRRESWLSEEARAFLWLISDDPREP